MKIVTDEAVYVQKNDLIFLNQTDIPIPDSIFMKTFDGVTIMNYSNRFDFVKFVDSKEIEFFKNMDFILEYDLVKDLEESQIIELGKSVAQQKNSIVKKYNAMSEEEKFKNLDMFFKCEKLDFKMYSLRDFLYFKQGSIQFKLPEEIKRPSDCKEHFEKGGFRRLLSKFKKKNYNK